MLRAHTDSEPPPSCGEKRDSTKSVTFAPLVMHKMTPEIGSIKDVSYDVSEPLRDKITDFDNDMLIMTKCHKVTTTVFADREESEVSMEILSPGTGSTD